MPLFGKKSKPVDDTCRKRLEYQLHLAKHGPDSIVDLSSCELKHVPSGIYAICRVLLKEVLLLHSNRLKTLKEEDDGDLYDDLLKLRDLRILDVHDNRLTELPPKFANLSSLQVLNLQKNQLRYLPDAICQLKSLQTLNVKENDLLHLPDALGDLCSLRTLDVSCNKITSLPKSLCQARCVETLIVDEEAMLFPPLVVCKGGTAEIMKFLCEASNIAYSPPSRAVLSLLNKPPAVDPDSVDGSSATSRSAAAGTLAPCPVSGSLLVQRTRSLGAKPDTFDQLARRAITYADLKDERRRELLRLEAELADSTRQQMRLLEMMVAGRKELLDVVAKEQTDSERQFHNLQERRELDRKRFLCYLESMEEHTKTLIAQLLDMNSKARNRESVLEQQERARQLEEGLCRVKLDEYERLRKKEVESAMEMNACQYFSLEHLRAIHDQHRERVTCRAMFEDCAANENVHALLQNRDAQMRQLLQRLIVEEQFQKEALLALMEQRDARSNRLSRQIALIQSELGRLSQLELRNREEKELAVKNRLREQREALCAMMMQLLEEKMHRSKELQKRLIEMEKEREKEQVDFWLVHYQRLLDSKPAALLDAERELDDDVVKVLRAANASDYILTFARHRIGPESLAELTEEDLQRMGMYEVGLRKAVMRAIGKYGEKNPPAATPTKISPVLELEEPERRRKQLPPTAPSTITARFEMECVVCMERECALVFMPCGHVCSCAGCAERLSECPLCRMPIQQRVDLSAGGGR